MRRAERLPYCGTCKTLGLRYGQPTRFLLNHDLVFLAELLMTFGGEPQWDYAYRSFNCFALPKPDAGIPPALEFAAAATVLLAHFHIRDQQWDTKKRRWHVAASILSPAYHRAAARLKDWGFPLDALDDTLGTQCAREARAESLEDVAEPTAIATALVFSHGARVIGRPDFVDSMHQIGLRFGTLVYILDAVEDLEKDRGSGDFNPLLAFPETRAREQILALTDELEVRLPAVLGARLRSNVEERLGLRLRVLPHRCRKTAQSRWRDAVDLARRLRDREQAGLVKSGLVFTSSAAMAFLFSHQVRNAESWRHAMGLGLNFMAIGAAFAATPPPPPIPSYTPPPSHPPGLPPMPPPVGKKSRTGCSWCCCDGDCCDGCDCCCDFGSCCECGSCCDC